MEFLFAFFILYMTWIHYLAVMHLKRHRDELSGAAKFLGSLALFIGLVFDLILNILASIPFLQPPLELTLTSRLKKNLNKDNFRGKLARWICHNLLDKFDPSGGHC